MVKLKKHLKENLLEIYLAAFSFLFSSWLMFSTFSYKAGSMLIATKAWSDFASSIPLIRSFSFGVNFPPEYPLFPGEPIHYHFIFFAFVGLLEKIGVRLDYALNIPSTIGFLSLLLVIYFLAKKLFNSASVGFLSVIFFLFNGSLSFIEFLKLHPPSINLLESIVSNKVFPSFGPYDGKIVSAFWNLNIYTNQRHLAFAFFLSLFIILVLLTPILTKKKLNPLIPAILGICLGFFFFFHLAVLLSTVIVIIALAILFKELRIPALIMLSVGGIISIPQYYYLQSGGESFKPLISIGYLAQNGLTFFSFLRYWFLNLGFHTILIPLGLFLATKKLRKIFLAFFLIFILGNTVQFSPEIAANHKFFNYFMIIGVMFSAFALVKLWSFKHYLKPVVVILIFFLTLSGIIDFFPIYNDSKIELPDYPVTKDIEWIIKNTPPDSVFLNTQYLYDPASMAGRKIFLGWPYFPWSAGYDTHKRGQLRDEILATDSKTVSCHLLKQSKIDYLEINFLEPNTDIAFMSNVYKEDFSPIYKNNGYQIFEIKNNCR